MRLYYDSSRDVLVVENSGVVYPPKGLAFVVQGEKVEVWQALGDIMVARLHYSVYQRADGSTFDDVPALTSYLSDEFTKSTTINGGFF